jgi:bifunctional non-homologous end joining protein LigD
VAGNSRYDRGLDQYRDKRDPQRTPEPFGRAVNERRPGPGAAGAGLFTVQLHAARRRHYDFRLELDGVLVSWAVPKGPSLDPAEKRLAMHVEDHPLEYATFEGVIPRDNYGAGAVIVWDTGAWTPLDDPRRGLEAGKLDFELCGYKLRGRFALVRVRDRKSTGKEWLLIKKADQFADPDRQLGDESVLSGLTVEELAGGSERSVRARAEIERLGAPRGDVDMRSLSPMLCQTIEEPFSDPAWIFELKYDGYRVLASRAGGAATLRYRSGRDATRLFPDVTRALSALPYESLVLDGEVVVFAADGRPVFNRLQQRTQLQGEVDIRRAATLHPATFMIFDLLAFEGHDLRGLPLIERKRLLQGILPGQGPLRYADHVDEHGREFYAVVRERGLEGVVAKRADSPYLGHRSDCWLKLRVERIDDFVIVGFTSPQGSRVGFGALHLAVWDDDRWLYAGRVGTGFGGDALDRLSQALQALLPWVPTFEPPSTPQRDDYWVQPALVCTVKYREWPEGGLVRFARFQHLREDKPPRECHRPRPAGHRDEPAVAAAPASVENMAPAAPAESAAPATGEPATGDSVRDMRLSNLDKVYWPATAEHPAYTKGDLIAYYRDIAPWIMPYLRDRPLVLTRYPDGIEGKSFFQKDAPDWVPDWIRTVTLWSKHAQREVHYFVCDDVDTLVYLVNLGTIPLHIWSSRMETLAQPDWTVLDLDPKGAPFAHVIEVARAIRGLCRRIELPSYIKTSGQAGLHVLIPLDGKCTYEQSRALAQLLAKVVEAQLPDIATTARPIERRKGKVYIDYVQNAHGRLIAAPLSARPVPGAPVSMPLRWREVNARLDPGRFTIATARRRMQRFARDPLLDALEVRSDLQRAVELLSERMVELLSERMEDLG